MASHNTRLQDAGVDLTLNERFVAVRARSVAHCARPLRSKTM